MKDARMEPYFGLFSGNSAEYGELGPTTTLVDIFVAEGTAVRQMDLFGGSRVWMPERVRERQEFEQKRLETVRAELTHMVRVPSKGKIYGA